jgi:hypothetical protein
MKVTYLRTEAANRWLEEILAERFGHLWHLSRIYGRIDPESDVPYDDGHPGTDVFPWCAPSAEAVVVKDMPSYEIAVGNLGKSSSTRE